MPTEYEKKVFAYITALEDVNTQLLNALKQSVEIMTALKPRVDDPHGWQEMLDLFQDTIKVAENTKKEETSH